MKQLLWVWAIWLGVTSTQTNAFTRDEECAIYLAECSCQRVWLIVERLRALMLVHTAKVCDSLVGSTLNAAA
jgi:hypothetical protein